MSQHSQDHVSRIDAPCLLHGTLGLSLAIVVQVFGLLQLGDDKLMAALLHPVFHGVAPESVSLLVQVAVCAVLCYGIAFVVLDVAGVWKRVIIGVSVLVLVLAMVPSFAVWNMYYSPFLTVVGVFWTWFFTLMYANHHLMPCEVGHVHQPLQTAPVLTPVSLPEPEVIEDESRKYQPKEVVKETGEKTGEKSVKESLNG